ncbi:MAG: hypothetical protein IJV22_00835 [Bacteroidales bacterium]|nr:hypothetical protein [Bacteroidales bacterium]
MFDNIKRYRQKKILKQLSDFTRVKRIDNFNHIKSVGIIFTVGSEQEWNDLYRFAKAQEQTGKQVWMAGYQHASTSINYIFTHAQTTICHEKEDFTFWGIPKNNVLAPFLHQRYQLLIDLTAPSDFFGKYTALKALSNLKVTNIDAVSAANDTDKERIFDLIIRSDKPLSRQDYFAEIIKYLNMVEK